MAQGQLGRVLPIRGIFVAPATKSAVFDQAVARLQAEAETRLNAACYMVKLPDEKPAVPLDRFRQQGYVVFTRSLMRGVWPNSVPGPGEATQTIRVSTAQGQREPACFALRALRDVGPVRLVVADLKGPDGTVLPKDLIELYWLRYIEQPHSGSGRQKDFGYRPKAEILRPVLPDTKVEVPEKMTRGLLVAVTPPADAAPGDYTGAIRILPQKAEPTEMTLNVEVMPFRLRTYPDDRARVLYYYGPNWINMLPSQGLYWERVRKDLENCHRYQVEPGYQVPWGTDPKEIARFVEVYRQRQWLGPLILGGGNLKTRIVQRALARKRGEKVPPVAQYYAEQIRWVADLVRMAKEDRWPQIAFYVSAEAAQKGMPEMLATKECLEALHAAVPDAKLMEFSISVAEVDVMATTKGLGMLSPNAACFTEENIAKCKKLGWELWHYGWKRNRFRNGISDWRMGSRGGFAEWYGMLKRGPLNPFDASGPDCWNDSPPFQGPDGPWATILQERMAAGRIDFLHLATLELTLAEVKKANPDAPAVAQAEAWLEALREDIYPHYTYYYRRLRTARKPDVPREVTNQRITGYGPEEFAQFRKEAGDLISALLRASPGK